MMTTPERLRRRQRIEGVCLLLVGILMIVQATYFHLEDREQRACFETKFNEFTTVTQARAELAARETGVTRNVLSVYAEAAGLVKEDPTKPPPPKDKERLQRELVDALLHYQAETRKIQEERVQNPVPEYPVGSCKE